MHKKKKLLRKPQPQSPPLLIIIFGSEFREPQNKTVTIADLLQFTSNYPILRVLLHHSLFLPADILPNYTIIYRKLAHIGWMRHLRASKAVKTTWLPDQMNLKTLKPMQIFRKAEDLQMQFPHRRKTRKKARKSRQTSKKEAYAIKGGKLSF
jgi:hypothetical protein